MVSTSDPCRQFDDDVGKGQHQAAVGQHADDDADDPHGGADLEAVFRTRTRRFDEPDQLLLDVGALTNGEDNAADHLPGTSMRCFFGFQAGPQPGGDQNQHDEGHGQVYAGAGCLWLIATQVASPKMAE
jgi:hypothetical protein